MQLWVIENNLAAISEKNICIKNKYIEKQAN